MNRVILFKGNFGLSTNLTDEAGNLIRVGDMLLLRDNTIVEVDYEEGVIPNSILQKPYFSVTNKWIKEKRLEYYANTSTRINFRDGLHSYDKSRYYLSKILTNDEAYDIFKNGL